MSRKKLSKILQLAEEASSSAPIEQQFITDLKYSIEQDAGKNPHKPSQTFKPSSIGGCERNLYYQLTGAEVGTQSRNSAVSVGILQSGTDRHERIQKAICGMAENGIDCEYIDVAEYVKENNLSHIDIVSKQGMETKCFWSELPLSFLTDGIIKYKGDYYILEIKTMGSKKFFESKDVRPEHIDQGICYSLAFGINKVIYLYEDRDSLNKKAYLLSITREMKDRLLNKTDRVKDAVSKNIPPEVKGKKNCAYCSYKEQCKKDSL